MSGTFADLRVEVPCPRSALGLGHESRNRVTRSHTSRDGSAAEKQPPVEERLFEGWEDSGFIDFAYSADGPPSRKSLAFYRAT